MQLVEQHIIQSSDSRWAAIDAAAFLSKNLYNAANYRVRQAYIFEKRYIPYTALDQLMKQNPDYYALPRKVSQWVLKQVDHDWQSFFAAQAVWQTSPERFTGRPRLPKYKPITSGRNLLVYTSQAISQSLLRQKGLIQPSQLPIQIKTQQRNIQQVRIVPRSNHYVVEVVYQVDTPSVSDEPGYTASIDLGVDHLVALTSDQPDFVPLLVNGRPLKAINQFYNKQRARLQSLLPEGQYTSKRLEAITYKRNQRINSYLHRASKRLIEALTLCGIKTLVVGKNGGWKQEVNLGSRNNQNFVLIPHARFIEMLHYKATLVGIRFIVTEESYTSKCSFLDNEPLEQQEQYLGKRVKRGLFRASDGRTIHADVNAAYNILRKVIPDALSKGIEGAVVHPVSFPTG